MLLRKIFALIQITIVISFNLYAQDIENGIKLIKNEKFSEAKKYFSSLTNTKIAAEAYFYIGQIYFELNKPDSANMFYQKGILSDKEYPLNYAGLVKVNILNKNSSEADKNREQAIELGDEKNPDVYIILSEAYNDNETNELLNTSLKIKPDYIPAYLALGKFFLKQNNGTEAIKCFDKVLNINPKNSEALTLKSEIYFLIDNYNAALSLLNEAVKDDSSYAPAYNELAELNYAMRDYSSASDFYGKYIEASEITLEKRKRFASILYLNKEYSKAINILEDVIQTEPENLVAVRILAYSNLRLDNIDSSITYFRRLFALDSVAFMPSDYENYSDLLDKTGNDSLAIEYLNKIIDIDSTRKEILGKISVLYFKDKNWDGVISTLGKKNTLTAQEYFDLGKAYYFVQNYAKADSAFKLLVSKMPELPIAYFWQARAKTNFDPESEQGLAKPFYEQFITFSKEDTSKFKRELIEAYSYLGYYYFIKGDKDNSKLYWQKVYGLDPLDNKALEALKNIK